MKIKCLHGYFIFEETKPGQISQFMSLFGFSLVSVNGYYTFEFLAEAPDFSMALKPYLGVIASATYAGEPWEVMRENDLVFDFNKDLVLPIQSVTQISEIKKSSNYFFSSGLILPGSFRDDGTRVTDYTAWLLWDSMKFKYTEVQFG